MSTETADSLSLDDILVKLDGGDGPSSACVLDVLFALAGDAEGEIDIEAEGLISALRDANHSDVADAVQNIVASTAEVDGMDFAGLEDNWTRFGSSDPLWSILTEANKRDNRWDVDEFFATGHRYAEQLFGYLAAHNIEPGHRRALDFGCGVGRLTQALCPHFDAVVGVDVAATMIDRARDLNAHGDGCTYIHNSARDLRIFEDHSFDFVNCHIVLQHMRPEYALGYIAEFLRILEPGGLAVFQIPTAPIGSASHDDDTGRLDEFSAALRAPVDSLSGAPGSRQALRVSVRNTSGVTWSGNRSFPINVGNHWLDSAGRMLVFDELRERIPGPVAPGEEIEVEMWITLPETPGEYCLELDVVQENVAWFANHDSPVLRLPVVAGQPESSPGKMPSLASAPNGATAPIVGGPRMEMFGTPPEKILSWVGRHGGRVLLMEQDWSAIEWYGYRYVVERC